jgi:ACS family hexuronate transporter-like MFS transporter
MVSIYVLTPSTPYWTMVAIFAVFGFTAIGWSGMNNTLIVELSAPETIGLTSGFSLMILLTGSIAGPRIFGYIADSTRSYSLAWWFLTISTLFSLTTQVFVQEEKRKIR